MTRKFPKLILLETPCRQLKTAINLISLFSVLLQRFADSRASSVYVYTLNTSRLDISLTGMGIDFKMVLLLKLTTIDSGNRLE